MRTFLPMRKFRKNLAANIRAIRGELTQHVFAKKIGIGQASLNRIENSEQNVSIDMLERISVRLKKPVGELLQSKE